MISEFKNPHEMTNDEIRELYDSNPDMLLVELARITGKTVAELKKILMGAA